MTPFISIIIPFYGTADPVLLQRCLDSIREQGMEEGSYEVILSEDASRTIGGARDVGMQSARGEYLFFVDADDWLLPNSLLPCLKLLENHSPDILKLGFQRTSRCLPSEPAYAIPSCTAYSSGADYMLRNNFMGVVWAHFFRRSFLETAGIRFSKTDWFDDEEFVAKAYFFAGKMLVTSYKVYAYYNASSSLTKTFTAEACRKRMVGFKEMLARLITFNSAYQSQGSLVRSEALGRRIRFLTIDYIRQMRRNKYTFKEINHELRILKQEALLPLPDRKYSWKYTSVRWLLNMYVTGFVK